MLALDNAITTMTNSNMALSSNNSLGTNLLLRLEKFGAEIQAVSHAEQRDEKARATQYREHLQGFDFNVCAGG